MALNGVIEADGDVDHYAFEAKKGQAFDVRVFARTARLAARRGPLGRQEGRRQRRGQRRPAAGPTATTASAPRRTATFVVGIRDHLNKGGPTHFYRIEVTPVAPQLTLSPQNENPQIGVVTAAVPRGNRLALLVNAGRADFGGDLNLDRRGPAAGRRASRPTP